VFFVADISAKKLTWVPGESFLPLMEEESPQQNAPKFEATPIPVSFMITESIDLSKAAAEFGEHLGAIAVQLGFPSTLVERAIVADTARFSEALAQFAGNRTFTNDHGLQAAAKTIRIPDTNPCRSAIVFNVSIVVTVLNAGHEKGWNVSEWPTAERHHFYVIAHELGHCVDHALRQDIIDDGTWRDEAGNRVTNGLHRNLHAFEFSRVYPEVAACVISGVVYADAMRDLDAKMNNEALLKMLDELATMANTATPNYGAITKRVAATFWFVLMQHAKFVGSRIGYTKITDVKPAKLWHIAEALPEVGAALDDVDGALVIAWKAYPEVSPEILPKMVESFHRISRACGYSMETRNGNEGVWWNNWTVTALMLKLRLHAFTANGNQT
jgi:hypothetical protein